MLGVVLLGEEERKRIQRIFDYDGTGQVRVHSMFSPISIFTFPHELIIPHATKYKVDMDEFTNAMVQEFCVIKEPKGALIEKTTRMPWNIPSDGIATIEVDYQIEKPGLFNVMNNEMMIATLEQLRSLTSSDQRMTVFKHVVNSPYYYMNAGQAQMLFEEMSTNTDGSLDLVVEILPQIVDEVNVIRFLDGNLTDTGKLALRIKLGNMYNAYTGNPTGHYLFDMKIRMHRIAAKKLSTIAVSESNFCREKGINTSQRGKKRK